MSRARLAGEKSARSRPSAAKPKVRWRILDDPVRSSGGSESRRRVEERGRAYSSREGVLVSTKQSLLTKRRWRRSLAVANAGAAEMQSSNGVVATEGVRGRAACSARGRESRRREARFGGARSSSTRARLCSNRRTDGVSAPDRSTGDCGEAEAGESPSSEAPPEIRLSCWKGASLVR